MMEWSWHGPSCVGCGTEVSGMGRCDDCGGALCIFCVSCEKDILSGYRLCESCLDKRKEKERERP